MVSNTHLLVSSNICMLALGKRNQSQNLSVATELNWTELRLRTISGKKTARHTRPVTRQTHTVAPPPPTASQGFPPLCRTSLAGLASDMAIYRILCMQCQAMARRIFKAFSNSLSLSPAKQLRQSTRRWRRAKMYSWSPKLYNLSLHIKSHRKLGKRPEK